MRYQLNRQQQLNCDIETAWKFFSSANNLSRITPKEVNFTVLTDVDDNGIYPGMEINYTVSPLFNIPVKWKTRIKQVDYRKNFIDFQEKGPYKYWNHFHEFIQNENGVLVKDKVDYELPFGFLGQLAHLLLVKKKLKTIFNYRHDVLEDIFNQKISAT